MVFAASGMRFDVKYQSDTSISIVVHGPALDRPFDGLRSITDEDHFNIVIMTTL